MALLPDSGDGAAGQSRPEHDAARPRWSESLRAVYGWVADEPLPHEFSALLAELARKSGK